MHRTLACLLWLLAALPAGASRADADAPFLWQVEGPRATHYLLGSVHLLPDTADELPAGIEDAYDAVNGLVFETDVGVMGQPQTQLGLLAAARSAQGLKAEVGDKMYAQLARHAAHLGMPMTLCEPYKAWFCALSLEIFSYRKAGFAGDKGVDEQLYRWAHEDGKDVRWFEQPGVQLGFFTGMPENLSRQFLASSMDEAVGDGGDDPAALLRAWRDNDVAGVEMLVKELKRRYPDVYQYLLAQRNRNWMPQLLRVIDGAKPRMVVAGAAHWVGPDGLVALLRARGYKVTPYVAPESQVVTQAGPRLLSVRR